jgi:hypothetical protein
LKTRGTEQKAWIRSHTGMPTLFLTKAPKTYDEEKTASPTIGPGKSGYLPAEN